MVSSSLEIVPFYKIINVLYIDLIATRPLTSATETTISFYYLLNVPARLLSGILPRNRKTIEQTKSYGIETLNAQLQSGDTIVHSETYSNKYDKYFLNYIENENKSSLASPLELRNQDFFSVRVSYPLSIYCRKSRTLYTDCMTMKNFVTMFTFTLNHIT